MALHNHSAAIKQNITLIEKAVVDSERRFIARVLRATSHVRHKITTVPLSIVNACFKQDHPLKVYLDGDDGDVPMQDDVKETPKGREKENASVLNGGQLIPEVECYVGLLCLIFTHDRKDYKKVLLGQDIRPPLIMVLLTSKLRA